MRTQLGEAFAKAGFRRHQMRAYTAAAEFIDAGGTEEEWVAVFRAVAGKAAGQLAIATSGQETYAGNPTNIAVGHQDHAGAGQRSAADCDTPRAEAGQLVTATAMPSLPAHRAPSAADITAARTVAERAAQSIFDRVFTASNKRWGNVVYTELNEMSEDGELARLVKEHIGEPGRVNRTKMIRELMTPREFRQLVTKAGKKIHG